MNTVLTTQIEIQKDALMNSRQVQSNIELDGHQNAVILEVQKIRVLSEQHYLCTVGREIWLLGVFPCFRGLWHNSCVGIREGRSD